jgi:hypothetical protein
MQVQLEGPRNTFPITGFHAQPDDMYRDVTAQRVRGMASSRFQCSTGAHPQALRASSRN